jgi:hypothetical protein
METLGGFQKGVASGKTAPTLTRVRAVEPRPANDRQQMKERTTSRHSVIYVDNLDHESRLTEQTLKRKRVDYDTMEDNTIHQMTDPAKEGGLAYQLSAVEQGLFNDAQVAWENACQHLDIVQDNLAKIAVFQRDFTVPVSIFQSICDTERTDKLWRFLELLRSRPEAKNNLPFPARKIT